MAYSAYTHTTNSRDIFDSFLPEDEPPRPAHRLKVHAGAATFGDFGDFDEEPVYEQEDLSRQVLEAQERLRRLRDEQDELQRKKEELEALNAKQAEFHEGRREMIDKLSRSAVDFEKESQAAMRRAEALKLASKTFRQHMAMIECIRPEEWNPEGMHHELDRAIGIIGEASEDYDTEMLRIESLGGVAVPNGRKKSKSSANMAGSGGEQTFLYWLRSGFAFTLPVVVLGLIALILVLTALGGDGQSAISAESNTYESNTIPQP